jgi:hypothetical protein
MRPPYSVRPCRDRAIEVLPIDRLVDRGAVFVVGRFVRIACDDVVHVRQRPLIRTIVEMQHGAIDSHRCRVRCNGNALVVFRQRPVGIAQVGEYLRASRIQVRLVRIQFQADFRARQRFRPLFLVRVADGFNDVDFGIRRAAVYRPLIIADCFLIATQLLQDVAAFEEVLGIERFHGDCLQVAIECIFEATQNDIDLRTAVRSKSE